MDKNKIIRALLKFLLGFIGSFIINKTSLKPEGYKSRTLAHFVLGIVTCRIYDLVAVICEFTFDPAKEKNIGYKKED